MNAATGQSATPRAWGDEAQRWRRFYADRLPGQLRLAVDFVDGRPAAEVRPHFDSCLALLNAAGQRAELRPLWLALVDRLHPLPVRWGEWSLWLATLQQAADHADALGRPAQQAEYLAHAADLLLNTGRLEPARDTAGEALRLAQESGAAWPLCLAGSVVAATLRAQARYGEAQTFVDELRADLARLPAAQPPARAAMGTARLDLETMDTLRHSAQPELALTLSETVIDRLADVPGIDPHDLATIYMRRATIRWAFDRYPPAADDLRRAAELYRQAGDELQATFAEANLGTVYLSMSRYGEAEALKLAAIRAAEEVNARHVLVSELGDLGVIYLGMGRVELLLEYSNRMVKLATELGNDAELSRGRGNRASALLALGRAAEALPDIESSLSRYHAQGRKEGAIVTTIDMVLYLEAIGDEAGAARLARENHAAALREDFPKLPIVTGRCLAPFLPPAERRALLTEMLAAARAYGRPMDAAGCLFALAAIGADPAERAVHYREGVELVKQMGATAWLAGRSPANPPWLPMMI